MGNELDRLRAAEPKLRYDHRLGRWRASTAVDIGTGKSTQMRKGQLLVLEALLSAEKLVRNN